MIISLLCILLLIAPSPVNDSRDQITLFIPAFSGEEYIGRNVATVLNLQIWQTLRKAPTPNPKNLNFGKGKILWSKESLNTQSHIASEKIASSKNILAQFVLWGKAWKYGNGIVVQAYLSIPKYEDYREEHLEILKTRIKTPKKIFYFSVDIPRRRYEFSPIILNPRIVNEYSSPSALKIYKEPNQKEIIGTVGDAFTALEHRGHYVQVVSNNRKGWVYLPKLSEERSELVDFVGGIIRIFRGDWEGAIELFDLVIKNSHTPTSLKTDTYIYKFIAKMKSESTDYSDALNAFNLNPYKKTSVVYSITGYLIELSKTIKLHIGKEKEIELIRKIEDLIESNKYLFSKSDPWLLKVIEVINSLR